jgi:outer membrane lipoprotein-sorting protein
MNRTQVLALVALLALVAGAGSARADVSGDKVLAAMDAAMNQAKTLIFEYEITNKEPGRDERIQAEKVWRKGEKMLTEFTAPADLKGTKVLVLSPTQMYVYLPSFGKVRRIASHTKDQGFLGLAFSQDDMATTRYGPLYSATVASEDAATWKLTLTPKAGQETPYAKIELTVLKDKKVPSELKYFNAEGKNTKTETRSGFSCEGDVCTPGELKMTDNLNNAWTRLTARSREVNKEILDDFFTQRNLGQ